MDEWVALIKWWERAAVTPEQVIGPLLRHGEAQGAPLVALPRRLEQVEVTLTGRLTQFSVASNRANVL